MRKPKPDTSLTDAEPAPAGGRALGRARQFAQSRGLPEPAADAAVPARKKAPPPADPAPPAPARKPPQR
jgi:hypothetical protein